MKSYNIRLDDEVLTELKRISSVLGKTVSDLVREGIEKILEEKKQDPYYRLTNFSETSQEETIEIIEEIAKLSDDDLKIVKRRRIKI